MEEPVHNQQSLITVPKQPEFNRQTDGTFGPGNNANPAGPPPKEKRFSEIARTLLESKEINITYTFPKTAIWSREACISRLANL